MTVTRKPRTVAATQQAAVKPVVAAVAAPAAKKPRKPRVALPKLSLVNLGEPAKLEAKPVGVRNTEDAATLAKLAELLQASYASDTALSFTVDNMYAPGLAAQLHQAAVRVKLGARVITTPAGEGMSKVSFYGKARTVRTRKPKTV